jgi:hypothetical protein
MASYFKQGIYAGASSGPDARAPPNGAIQFHQKNGAIHLCVCMDDDDDLINVLCAAG